MAVGVLLTLIAAFGVQIVGDAQVVNIKGSQSYQ
jgi:hypothetical protein